MNEQSLFIAALECDPGRRNEFLDNACGGDAELRQRLNVLLAANERGADFMDQPAGRFAPTIAEPPLPEKPGTQIGPYKLLEQIGEGGFGMVFMAEQQHPVRRKVAIKVLKPGMDTRQVIARFEAERQALALMDHPHIAKVLDAGATESGRPYFVMELVRGVNITEHCDANRLTPRERLELFVAVCQAVQHAHQKGIIHRDIKPSNVLVTKHDGVPVVKVIDFGVAKALGQQLTDKTVFTAFAQMIGTPLYMSPEQAELSGLDIDTRTDVYSLGVLLYELLTGTTPFDKDRLRSAAFDEIRRIIREEEPQKPSTRLSSLSRSVLPSRASGTKGAASQTGPAREAGATSLASVAALRKMEPRRLSQLVRGDLDWIVMKALEKDRNRRYETASGFALDIQRYLADEPVAACPPSAAYRFRKFARRNKAAFAIGMTVAAALLIAVLALAVSNRLVRRESSAKEIALQEKTKALGEKDAALGEREAALKEKDEALQTTRFQEGLAKKHAATAEEQRQKAAQNEAEARAQESLARRRSYAAQMNLAQHALEAGNTAAVLELLDNHRPRFDEEDLRGFEWYHLWAKCHHGLGTWLSTDRPIKAMAFAPDGRTLAMAGRDGAVMLSDAQTGAFIGRLSLADGFIPRRQLAFSPDRKTLAIATMEGIDLWDWKAQKLLGTLDHGPWNYQPAFFPGGRLLATVNSNGMIWIWDMDRRSVQATLPATQTSCVAITSDGMLLAAGGGSGVSVWKRDGESWKKQPNYSSLSYPVSSIAFSPDSALLVTATRAHGAEISRIQRVEPGDGTVARPGRADSRDDTEPPDPESLVPGQPSPCGVRVWDVATGEERVVLKGRGVVGWVGDVAFTPDSKMLAVSNHGSVLFYNLRSGLPQITSYGSPAHTSRVSQVQFSPDGRYLATAADNENFVKIWDRSLPPAPDLLAVAGGSNFIAFSADEQTLLAGSSTVKRWDLTTGRELKSWNMGEGGDVLMSALASDGRLIATLHPDMIIRVRDLESGQEVARSEPLVENANPPFNIAFAPGARTLAVTAQPWALLIWDFSGNIPLQGRYGSFASWGWCGIGYSPDGQRLGVGALDGTVHLFDARSGERLNHIAAGSSWSTVVAFSPDSRSMATANRDGTLKLLNPDNGNLNAALGGHGDVVTAMTFFADGQTLVTGTEDGAAKLWDMTTRQELLTFHGHRAMVNSAAAKRDGSLLATSSVDGQVRLYHARRPPEATAARTELNPEQALSPVRQLDAAEQFWAEGRLAEAAAACAAAQVRLQTLSERFPQERQYRRELARGWLIASLIHFSPQMSHAGSQAFDRAVDSYRRLPGDLQQSVFERHHNLTSKVPATPRQNELLEALFAHLVVFFDALATADPKVLEFRARAAYMEGRLAVVLSSKNRRLEALAACERARDRLLKLHAEFPTEEHGLTELAQAWSEIGTFLRWTENVPEALAAYTRAIEIQPDNLTAWEYRVEIETDEEMAIHDFTRILELSPSNSIAWANRGRLYTRQQRFDLAVADLTKALELAPWPSFYALNDWNDRAWTYAHWGRWAEALADFSHAVELAPNAADIWRNRGAQFIALVLVPEAAADYARAFQLEEPADSLAELHHALLRRCVQDAPGFADACRRMLARFADSVNPDDWHNVAQVLASAPEPVVESSRIVTLAERAVADNKSVWRVANLGLAQLRAGQFERAAAALEGSLTIDANWNAAGVYAVLAMAQHGLKDREKAAVALAKARHAREERIQAMLSNAVGFWPAPWWDVVHAELLYREAYELIHASKPPEDARLLVLRGRALSTIGRANDARGVLDRAVELHPGLGEAWYWRGVLAISNEPDKALADLQKAIANGFRDVELLKNDSRLDPLRTRDDFRDLLNELFK